jgi:hypothetical protein
MHTDWKTPYQFAIREQNPAKLEDLYEQARHAIHNRVLELEENVADVRESGELDEALRQLTIHKYSRIPVH